MSSGTQYFDGASSPLCEELGWQCKVRGKEGGVLGRFTQFPGCREFLVGRLPESHPALWQGEPSRGPAWHKIGEGGYGWIHDTLTWGQCAPYLLQGSRT